MTVTFQDIEAANARLRPSVRHTPLITSRLLSEMAGCDLRMKGEHLQRGGSFKLRGALNKLLLEQTRAKTHGVVAFSSGNHAQGVALAALLIGCRASIVMPSDAPRAKLDATRAYGADIVLYDRQKEDREAIAKKMAADSGALLVPPFDDDAIIAGQGTAGIEIARDVAADVVLVPVGGGGFLAGVALAVKTLIPDATVVGVEPEVANDAQQSFRAQRIVRISAPKTIADGMATAAVGERPFAIIRQHVDDIVTVSEQEIWDAMGLITSRTKQVIEPSGAVATAAALFHKIDLAGKKVVSMLCGGNLDFSIFARRTP